ncbi:MAG: hypothetical protein ACRYFS_17360 [Janthinobacterium lividum]
MALDTLFTQPSLESVPVFNTRKPASPPVSPNALPEMRATLTRLHDTIVRLRYEDPKKGTRASALTWVARETEKLGDRCWELGVGLGSLNGAGDVQAIMGFDDPEDPFGGDQVLSLRKALAELTAGDAPYPVPLPPGCALLPQANFDPFEHGRLYNGMLSAPQPVTLQLAMQRNATL